MAREADDRLGGGSTGQPVDNERLSSGNATLNDDADVNPNKQPGGLTNTVAEVEDPPENVGRDLMGASSDRNAGVSATMGTAGQYLERQHSRDQVDETQNLPAKGAMGEA